MVLASVLVGSLYAVYTPLWQAPDEPAHYNYIRQLASGRFPVMQNQDYDESYRNAIISSGFDSQYSIEPLSYEDYQPPLYYLLQTPIFWLTDGNLRAMRLFAVLLGVMTLTLAYIAIQRVFNLSWLTLTAVAFIAFLPQHVAIQASLNNDALSELLITALLTLLIYFRIEPLTVKKLLTLGFVLGLALLTKVTAYLMAPVIGLALVWRYWPHTVEIIKKGLTVASPAVLLGSMWWLRNLLIYGWPDFLGIQAHDAAVVGQLLTRDYIAQNGIQFVWWAFWRTTFQSFWGQFGWMGVVMPAWVYQLLLLFTALVALGLLINFFQPQTKLHPYERLLFITLLLLNVALYLTYNLTYVQHQGRYLFAALMPISIGVAIGCSVYTRPLLNKWSAVGYILPVGVSVGLFGLDLLALFRFILPTLAP